MPIEGCYGNTIKFNNVIKVKVFSRITSCTGMRNKKYKDFIQRNRI